MGLGADRVDFPRSPWRRKAQRRAGNDHRDVESIRAGKGKGLWLNQFAMNARNSCEDGSFEASSAKEVALLQGSRRGAWWAGGVQAEMFENLPDDVEVLDEGDDFSRGTTFRAIQNMVSRYSLE
jgi:hypothetical protein